MEDAFGGVIAPFLVEAAAELTNLEGEMRGLREESGGYRCDPSPCRYPAVTQPLPSCDPSSRSSLTAHDTHLINHQSLTHRSSPTHPLITVTHPHHSCVLHLLLRGQRQPRLGPRAAPASPAVCGVTQRGS